MAASIFMLSKSLLSNPRLRKACPRWIAKVADASMGIYAVHAGLIMMIADKVADSLSLMLLAIVPIAFISIIVALLMKRIPRLGDIIA